MLKALRGGVQPVAVKVFPLVGPHAARSHQDFEREVSELICALTLTLNPNPNPNPNARSHQDFEREVSELIPRWVELASAV